MILKSPKRQNMRELILTKFMQKVVVHPRVHTYTHPVFLNYEYKP